MLVLGLGMNCMKERRDCGTRYEYLDRTPKFGRLASLAGVVQWQNGSFPSCIRGFDSLRPLQLKNVRRDRRFCDFLRRPSLSHLGAAYNLCTNLGRCGRSELGGRRRGRVTRRIAEVLMGERLKAQRFASFIESSSIWGQICKPAIVGCAVDAIAAFVKAIPSAAWMGLRQT